MQKWIGIVCIMVGACAAAWGQATRDYTAGFERLFMLGLPDVSEAEYVKLDLQGHHRHFDHDWSWRRIELEGNAWLLEKDEDGTGRYLYNDGRVITVYDRAHLQRLQREEAQADGQDRRRINIGWEESRISGTATPADLAADLQKATAYLKGEDDSDRSRAMRRHELDSVGGRMFVFAALAHRNGLQEEATELVNALFAIAPEPREVILNGLDHMANQQYADLYYQWTRDKKWEAFAVELQALIQRFRTGWVLAPIAEIVRADLENRLDDSGPPLLEGVTEEQQALAKALADAGSPGMHRQHGFWIFPRSAWQQTFSWGDQVEDHPVTKIKAMGLDAVPFLLAMLDDRYPTTMSFSDLSSGRTTYGSMRNRTLDEQWTWRFYDSMNRPATRGDVSRVLLSILVREEERASQTGIPPSQIRDAVETWWARFGEMSLDEIARIYLNEGLKSQRAAAGLHLMHTGDPADVELVEKAIMTADDPVDVAELAMSYARVKGAESQELLTPYIEQLRDGIENLEGERSWERHGLQQVLRNLETLLSDETVEAYLEDVLAGDETFDSQRFMRLAGRGTLRLSLKAILDALVETNDPAFRGDLLNVLSTIRHWRAMSWQFHMETADEEPGPWIIDDFADQWGTLLESTDTTYAYGATPVTLQGRVAQFILSQLADQEDMPGHYRAMSMGGAAGLMYYVDWARQRVDNRATPLPALPTASDVGTEEREALTRRLLDADPSAIESFLNALSLQERMALSEELSKDESLRQHVTAYANRIVWVRPTREHEQSESIDALRVNRTFDAGLIHSLLENIKTDTAAGGALQVSVVRAASLDGVTIAYGAQPASSLAVLKQARDEPHVMGTFSGMGRSITNVRWPLEAEATGGAEADDEFDLFDDMLLDLDEQVTRVHEEQREAFWEQVQRIESGAIHPHHYLDIQFIGVPAWDDTTGR